MGSCYIAFGWPVTHYVAQTALRLTATLLFQLAEYWNYRHVLLPLAYLTASCQDSIGLSKHMMTEGSLFE